MANNYYNFPVPFIAGTKVRSDQVNTQYSGIEAGFDLLSTDPDASIIGTSFFGTDVQGATVNEYLITTPDPRTPLVNGQRVSFFATHSNDGAVTLNVDSTGLIAGVNLDGDAVVDGQIVSGQFYEWVYDNANTQWLVTKGISGITDPLLLSNGSAGAPTYSFELDPDTGMYRQAADALGLSAGGVEVIRLINVGGGNEQLVVEPDRTNNSSIPSLAFGDADSGFKESADDSLVLLLASTDRWFWSADTYGSLIGTGPAMLNEAASGTNPTLIPDRSDGDTGLGHNGAGEPSLIGNGVELARGVAAGSGGLLVNNTLTGGGIERVLTTGDAGGLVGDVFKVGTPVNNQVGVWTGDGTIEGTAGLTYDGATFNVTGNITLSGTVDGIDIATDVAANTAKVTNATHTGQVTGATALALDVTAITAQPASGAIVAADTILTNDGGVLSEATFTQMITFFDANLGGGGGLGNVTKVGTPVDNELAVWTGDGTLEGEADLIYNGVDFIFGFNTGRIKGSNTNAGAILNENASSVNPTLVPNTADSNTGIGSSGVNNLQLIARSTTAVRYQHSTAAGGEILWIPQFITGLSASATQTQGNGLLNGASFSEITTVATANDVITLPQSAAGHWQTIINTGAEILQIFPSSGDAILPNAVDASITLAVNQSITFQRLDVTNWIILSQPQLAGAGDVFKVGTPANDQLAVWTGDGTLEGNANFNVTGTSFLSTTGNGPAIRNVASSSTIPTLIPRQGDLNTGISNVADDRLGLVAGGELGMQLVAGSGGVIHGFDTNAAVTAFAGGGQGSATSLPQSYNIITTVATTGDSVKLPAINHVGGLVYIKNDGANACDVFPASGDNLGQGIDTALSVSAGAAVTFMHSVSNTTWTQIQFEEVAGTGDVTKVGTPVNNEIGVWTGDGTIEGDANFTWDGSTLALPAGVVGTPSLTFGDADTGLFAAGVGQINISINGVENYSFSTGARFPAGTASIPTLSFQTDVTTGFFRGGAGLINTTHTGTAAWQFGPAAMGAILAGGPALRNEVASATNPTFLPNNGDADSGLGQNALDELSLIGGGVELLRAVEATGANQIIVAPGVIQDAEATPSLAFGDGDTGFYEEVDDTLAVALAGAKEFEFGPLAGADPQFGDVELLTNQDGADGATTFTEQSQNGASATFVGTAELDTAQFKFGTASLLLDGNSDYQHYPDDPAYTIGSSLFTIEGFVRFASLPAVGDEMTMVSQWVIGGGTDRAFAVSLIQDGLSYRIRFEAEGGTGVFEQGGISGTPPLNTWIHFAAQRSAGDTLSIWWDGLLEFEAGGIFTGTTINDSTTTLKLGVLDPTGGANAAWVDGWIDEVRITIGSTRYTPGGSITVPTSAFPTNSGQFTGATAGAGKLFNQVGSMTTPTLAPRNDDDDTGIGGDGDDVLSVIVGGFEALRYTELNDAVITAPEANLAVTAFATGGQGSATQLDSGSNVLTTVATTGDSVKLPPVFAANSVIYIKNDGANAADVFPATGDDLGAGVNTAVSLAAGASMSFIATVANSTWTQWIVDQFASGAGDVFKVGTPVNNQIGVWTGDGTLEGDADFTWDGAHLLLPLLNDATTPTLAFGDGGDGIFSSADGVLDLSLNGVRHWQWTDGTDTFQGVVSGSAAIRNVTTSATVATLAPNRNDQDSGIGQNAVDQVSLIGGGVEIARAVEAVGANQFIVSPGGPIDNAAAPMLAFGDGDTGIYENGDDNLRIANGGVASYAITASLIQGLAVDAFRLDNSGATATNPTLRPNRSDGNSGVGQNALDELSLIAGGFELLRISEIGNAFILSGTDPAADGGILSLLSGDSGVGATGDGGDINIFAGASVATAGDGGAVEVKGGAGFFTGKGGTIHHEVGSGGAAGPGTSGDYFVNTTVGLTAAAGLQVPIPGLVSIYGVGRSGEGAAGDLELWGGYANGSTAAAVGGDLLLFGGGQGGGGGGSGGNAHLYGGESDTLPGFVEVEGGIATVGGHGGDAFVRGGAGFGGDFNGGLLIVEGGDGVGTGNGGQGNLIGGDSGTGATGNGGNAEVKGGEALSTNGNGGDVELRTGAGSGSGTDGDIILRIGGNNEFTINGALGIHAINAAGPAILNEAATATNPTLVPNQADPDTGLGWNAAGEPSLVGNGVELARGVAAASGGLQANNADTGGGLERVLTESDLVVSFPEFQFFADQFENPVNADWTVNALAPAAADSNNNGLTVRLFDDTTEEGVGFIVEVPAGATNIVFDFVSRAETAPGAVNTVGLDIYNRGVPDNAAVQAWSASTALTDISIPTNEFFQEDTQTVTLASLGITAGETTQFELVRTLPGAGTDLTGDWALLLAKVSFT